MAQEAKRRWNAAHYTQVKVSVKPQLAEAFKAKCALDGVSMAGEISRFMLTQTAGQAESKTRTNPYATRPKRRGAVKLIIKQLNLILDAEQGYLDNIPLNLQNSAPHDAAELTVSALEEALSFLSEAY